MSNNYIKNSKSVFVCNGASNHTDEEREENDYYATEPKATELLLEVEKFNKNIWEVAVGELHMADVLEKHGYIVYKTDIIERSRKIDDIVDFLKYKGTWNGDIITNPAYKNAKKFVEKALEVIPTGNKVAMFLKLTFLESKSRKELFLKYPPKVIYVSSSRLQCAKNGDFETYNKGVGTAVAYAWYIWKKGYQGDTVVKWIN